VSWLDKLLKGIFKDAIHFDFSKKINIRNLNINIIKNETSDKVKYNEKEKQLSINLHKLNSKEREEIRKSLNFAVKKEDKILLENDSEYLIEDIKLKDKDIKNRKILKFFKGKIPPDDYKALRASLYLRSRFREGGENISGLKLDIMEKYGERGKNITNLCTAGYFENWLIPLYKEMKKEDDFTNEKFLEIYNIVIRESAFAVFVNRSMSSEQTKDAIMQKMETNSKYGIKFLNIHGIGNHNVNKIKETISEIEKEKKLEKSIEEKQNIIIVRIKFLD